MMSADILSYAMLTDKVTFTRSKQSGPLGLGQKKDKIVSRSRKISSSVTI